jgi:UDP-N-acetylglucosamine 4,6-dehydratase
VIAALQEMQGTEVFVPKLPSMRIVDLARAVAPECRMETIGFRPGEKLHETLITEDEARTALEYDDRYVILPSAGPWDFEGYLLRTHGRPCPEGFRYASDSNAWRLTVEELQTLVAAEVEQELACAA